MKRTYSFDWATWGIMSGILYALVLGLVMFFVNLARMEIADSSAVTFYAVAYLLLAAILLIGLAYNVFCLVLVPVAKKLSHAILWILGKKTRSLS